MRGEEYCGADCREGVGTVEVCKEGRQAKSVRAEREKEKKKWTY